MVKALIDSSVG